MLRAMVHFFEYQPFGPWTWIVLCLFAITGAICAIFSLGNWAIAYSCYAILGLANVGWISKKFRESDFD